MARFDVYRQSRAGGHLLDCQADAIGQLNTRLVVPLLEAGKGPPPIARLNPSFRFGESHLVMYTQFASALPVRELGTRIGSLADEHDRIMNAFDMLLTGY